MTKTECSFRPAAAEFVVTCVVFCEDFKRPANQANSVNDQRARLEFSGGRSFINFMFIRVHSWLNVPNPGCRMFDLSSSGAESEVTFFTVSHAFV
jgi:hypothetical protein